MPDVTKIKLPDGTVYNIKDTTSGYVDAAGASAAAPVQSVNTKTGAVTLSASDVGALPSNTVIPTVTNTYSSTGTDAVSGTAVYSALQTLDSSITATANSAISAITITDGKISSSSKIAIPSKVSALTNDAAYISLGDVPQEIFVATYSTTTYSDALAAYNAGKVLFAQEDSNIYTLGTYNTSTSKFDFFYQTLTNNKRISLSSSGWDSGSLTIGSVTKVIAGTGLKVDSAGTSFTGSGTINHTNSVTSQTTQAVYPITIDTEGHIASYGTAVAIPSPYDSSTNPGGYLTISTLPIYDGAVQSNARGVEF